MFYHRQEAAGQRQKAQEQDQTANLKNLPGSRCCAPSLVAGSVVLGAHVDGAQARSPLKVRQRIHILEPPAQSAKMSSKLDFAILIATPEQSNRDK